MQKGCASCSAFWPDAPARDRAEWPHQVDVVPRLRETNNEGAVSVMHPRDPTLYGPTVSDRPVLDPMVLARTANSQTVRGRTVRDRTVSDRLVHGQMGNNQAVKKRIAPATTGPDRTGGGANPHVRSPNRRAGRTPGYLIHTGRDSALTTLSIESTR